MPDQLPLSRALAGESVSKCVLYVRHDRGPGGVWLSVNSAPLRNERGGLRGGVAVFRDVTDERRLRRLRVGVLPGASFEPVTVPGLLRRHLSEPAADIFRRICAAAREQMPTPQPDDMAMLVCEVGAED